MCVIPKKGDLSQRMEETRILAAHLDFYRLKIKPLSGVFLWFIRLGRCFESQQRLWAAIILPCTCGMGSICNDVAYPSWCCFGCFTVQTVCTQLCELPVCLSRRHGKQVFDSWWVLLCWERLAHLSSNELHETDCFFILHLTLQQKWAS